jgi:hypothetical protein
MATNIQVGLAIFIGANLLFMVWLWYRAPPESGDKLVLPTSILLSIAMLILILPKLLWPNSEGIQIGGAIASILPTTAVTITSVRRNRRLREGRRSV